MASLKYNQKWLSLSCNHNFEKKNNNNCFILKIILAALDKLGMRSGTFNSSANGTGPVEPALPNTVFDVASLALYGCQALPIRLKILLDRLFSVLPPEDVVQVLTGFGWSLEDYARGYILQVSFYFVSLLLLLLNINLKKKTQKWREDNYGNTHTHTEKMRVCV